MPGVRLMASAVRVSRAVPQYAEQYSDAKGRLVGKSSGLGSYRTVVDPEPDFFRLVYD